MKRQEHGQGGAQERDQWAAFLAALPTVEQAARWVFRYEYRADRRAEAVQECTALAWKRWLRLVERGLDPAAYLPTFARRTALAVREGRRAAGKMRRADVMSRAEQPGRGVRVGPLTAEVRELLTDDTRAPVPDQVAFRLDWAAWLPTHSQRDRRMMSKLGRGEAANAVAAALGLSPGRITQIRTALRQDWEAFAGK